MSTLSARLPMLAWLVLVWLLLWARPSPAVLLTAPLVAVACWALTGLPGPEPAPAVRPVAAARALGAFVTDLVRSTVAVVVTVVRRGRRTRSAIVTVSARNCSDVAVAVVSNRISLVPGTLVLDVDRDDDVLYVHVLDVRDVEDVERARRSAQRAVDQVLAGLGELRGRGAGS